MCVVHVRRDWCTQGTVLSVREGATYGRRKNKILSRLFFKIVLADAEEADKVIIIAPISESDTLLLVYPTNCDMVPTTRVRSV